MFFRRGLNVGYYGDKEHFGNLDWLKWLNLDFFQYYVSHFLSCLF